MHRKAMVALMVVVVVLGTVGIAFAQQEERVTVPKSMLTEDQLARLKTEQTIDQIEAVGQYAGLGKEIGTAVSDSLNAITDTAAKFAETKVGKFTMWMVAYKILGNDLLHLAAGIVLAFVWLPIWVWSYKRCLPSSRILINEKREPNKGKVIERNWQRMPDDYDNRVRQITHALFFVGLLLTNLIVFFGG